MEDTPITRILIIDDDVVFTEVLERAFNKRGLLADKAYCIDDALQKVQAFKPDLVTLDLKMERESGLELLPQLLQCNPELKIVVLTGYSSIATTVQAIKLGACNYLCKPANADQILEAFSDQSIETVAISDKPASVGRMEWEHIQRVLTENEGNISATARALGMHRRTLQRKLQKRPVRA